MQQAKRTTFRFLAALEAGKRIIHAFFIDSGPWFGIYCTSIFASGNGSDAAFLICPSEVISLSGFQEWFQNLNKKQLAAEAAGGAGRTVGRIIGLALKIVLTILLIIICTGFLFVLIFSAYVRNTLSEDLSVSLSEYSLNQTSTIWYWDKNTQQYEVLERLSGKDGDRQWVNYEELNPYFEKAAVAIEDHRFYEHYGVDWFRTFGAFYTVFFSDSDSVFGGSTLTQQLLKNVTQYDDMTVKRKLVEIFRALKLEKTYTKEEIVEWYLNAVYFGNRKKGVQSASRYYFGKDQSELTAAECAAIIGITNNPSMYDPFEHPEANKKRQETILDEMYKYGYIETEAQLEEEKARELVLDYASDEDDSTLTGIGGRYTSWYVDALIEDVIHDLMELKDVDYDTAETLLFSAGYNIYSVIDMGVQDIIDDVYSTFDNIPSGYRKSSGQDLQSAIVLMDPKTGDILGLSGGIGKKTGSRIFNRATQMERSPGSTIKPLSSYSLCLDKGLVWPWTIFDDSDLVKLNGTTWYPNNDDSQNEGGVTLRYALQVSINTVAAQMIDMLTPQVAYDQLVNKLGFTHLVADGPLTDINYPGMALGQLSYGETVREMCQAYTIFCNDGIYTEGRTYSRIEDFNGKLVYDNIPESHVAVSSTTAYYMTEMLNNAANRGTGWLSKFGNMAVAGKSGGSSDWKDRWYCAYTPYLLASVWTGYDIPENMGSSNPATGMWRQVMERVHDYFGYEDTQFTTPEGMKRVTICCDTGLLASDACSHEVRGDRTMTLYMNPNDIPTTVCNVHVYTTLCSTSMDLCGPNCPADCKIRRSVLDLSKTDEDITLPLYFRNGSYPRKSWYSSESALKARIAQATNYTKQSLVSCRSHNLDPKTGWYIESTRGYLINPETGMYYDPATDRLIDQYSWKQIDWYTGYLIDPDTGDFIDPYTGNIVQMSDEEYATYRKAKYIRPPGYGPANTDNPASPPIVQTTPTPAPETPPPDAELPVEPAPPDEPAEGNPEDLTY